MTTGHPMAGPPTLRRRLVAAAVIALSAGAVLAQTGFDFMPDGGRNLMVLAVDGDPGTLVDLAAQTLDAEGWRTLIDARQTGLTEAQVQTLASYMALNLPLSAPGAVADLAQGGRADALPRDGKDLAIRYCQGCHGFYNGYLGHDRDVNGWLVMFNSPFHTEIRMTPVERRTFAQYSAINLPLPMADVPADLRH